MSPVQESVVGYQYLTWHNCHFTARMEIGIDQVRHKPARKGMKKAVGIRIALDKRTYSCQPALESFPIGIVDFPSRNRLHLSERQEVK